MSHRPRRKVPNSIRPNAPGYGSPRFAAHSRAAIGDAITPSSFRAGCTPPSSVQSTIEIHNVSYLSAAAPNSNHHNSILQHNNCSGDDDLYNLSTSPIDSSDGDTDGEMPRSKRHSHGECGSDSENTVVLPSSPSRSKRSRSQLSQLSPTKRTHAVSTLQKLQLENERLKGKLKQAEERIAKYEMFAQSLWRQGSSNKSTAVPPADDGDGAGQLETELEKARHRWRSLKNEKDSTSSPTKSIWDYGHKSILADAQVQTEMHAQLEEKYFTRLEAYLHRVVPSSGKTLYLHLLRWDPRLK